MSVTDRRGVATAPASRIRDCDVLVYRDLLMLEHRIRHRLSFDQIGTLYGLDPSYVGKRIRAIPPPVCEQMRRFLAAAGRTGEPGLDAEQFAGLARDLKRKRGGRRGVA